MADSQTTATSDTTAQTTEMAVDERVNGHRTIARLADELLPLLIARLGASGLGELEVRQDGWRVRLRRSGQSPSSEQASVAAGGRQAGTRASERRDDNAASGDPPPDPPRRERGRRAITSPAVGYYQPRDRLSIGMKLRGGDVLGHVEVLGVRQEVVVPEDGILAALSAEPGEAVEYGQPLARLEPEGRR